MPILCAEKAPDCPTAITASDGVADLVLTNGRTLGRALTALEKHIDPNATKLDAIGFDLSPYRPTPTIIEAAQALYAGHEIADIGRGDAGDAELQAAASTLQCDRGASQNGEDSHRLLRHRRAWGRKDAARVRPGAEESLGNSPRRTPLRKSPSRARFDGGASGRSRSPHRRVEGDGQVSG